LLCLKKADSICCLEQSHETVTNVPNASHLPQFTSYERLLWRVLATLARHGFVAPPNEGRDLIHDFYVEAWPGVLERFDEAKSAFTTYLSAAFYKFARRRIVSLQNWRYRFVDLDAIADTASDGKAPHELVEDDEQVRFITKALLTLPSVEREVLYAYLSGGESSERTLARKFAMSRYALREALANAVSRLAVEVGKLPAANTLEAKVADCLWRRGRSPRSAAGLLGVSVAEVNAARSRFASELLEALRGVDAPRTHGRTIMDEFLDMLRAALRSPGDERLLQEVRKHAGEILKALSEREGHFDVEHVDRSQTREWVARVYAELAGEDDGAQETAIGNAMLELRAQEAEEIGEAFERMLNGLDPDFSQWGRWFPALPRVDQRTREYLARDRSVSAAGEYGEELLVIGLTPMMFHGAARGFQLMLDRALRSANGDADPRIAEQWLRHEDHREHVMRLDMGAHGIATVPFDTAVAQVAGTKNLPAARRRR
jgi:RNA polymerase sigma factor (sigma-70 family)